MTATRTAALVVATLLLLTACGDGPDPTPVASGGAPPTGPASPSPERPASAPPSTPPAPPVAKTGGAPTPGGRPPTASPARATAATPTGAGDPDRRGDLVRGYRSLTGTVDRSGDWVLLRSGDTTWALLGARADALPEGRGATVAGVQAPLPPGCPADHALTLR
ncbi:hypothetical protein ACFY3U_18685 [Micromonospora sp. NPDC000089]|uniref:hypothetical protein n=1 Tax=unclassified Micromonospora TaxID=2617518 RepID=UPI0036C72367